MIERHLNVTVQADKAAAFEAFFAETYQPPMSETPGYRSSSLLKEAADPTKYQMVLRFESAEASTVWRESATHEALQPPLRELIDDLAVVAYEIVV
jgi:heme-degrading monooxygenase HmoA